MALITSETLAWLRDIYNNCGPFSSDRELSAVFVDERIAPWRDDLPEADSRIDRIDVLIEYLFDQFSVDTAGELEAEPKNALVLFTQVLVDRTALEDVCYASLQSVAQKLTDEIKQAEMTADDIITGTVPTVSNITDAALLDQLISNQIIAIRSYQGFAIGLVILGCVVAALGFALPAMLIATALKPWVGMGGIFIASLSVLQFKEVLNRKEKVGLFTTMKGRLSTLQYDADYNLIRERIDKLIWQVIERAAVE